MIIRKRRITNEQIAGVAQRRRIMSYGVNLPQKVEDISSIEYQIGNRRCRMDEKRIAAVAQVGARGMTSIILRDCNGAAP